MRKFLIGFLGLGFIVLSACTRSTPAPVSGPDNSGISTQASLKDTYVVKAGDTLYNIARAHGMDFRELVSLNNIENPNQIAVGRVLRVKSSGASVAAVTQPVTSEGAVEKRPLSGSTAGTESEPMSTETRLIREPKAGKIPYSDQAFAQMQDPVLNGDAPKKETEAEQASAPETKPTTSDDVPWMWPVTGKLAKTFVDTGNKGIDIAGKAGTPVLAAGEGTVVYSGVGLKEYGKLVIIKHNANFLSVYAHNQVILVKEGQNVSKGQKIAEMGNTDAGQYKLHFEIRRQGKPVDPMKFLPER